MNLHHFYFRGYYQGLDYQKIIDGRAKTDKILGEWFARKNAQLLDYKASESALGVHQNGLHEREDYKEILLQTAGQGLLSGSGYAHETGSMGELKLGFYFDPISGLPTLPGHSIKGLLRAVFPGKEGMERPAVRNTKAKWICGILGEKGVEIPDDQLAFVEKLKLAIFEGEKSKSISQHDVFLEASMTQQGKFLGKDALAPHNRKAEGLKNPVPIPFLKVLPGIPFRFAFLLKASKIDGNIEVSAEAKLALFESILTTFGAGAKTRGGYGLFEKIKAAPATPKTTATAGLLSSVPASRFKDLPLKTTENYEALVLGKNDKGKTKFVLLAGEIGKGTTHTQKWPEELAEGEIISVKVVLNVQGQIQELRS